MKLNHVGATFALLAAAGSLVGCSSDQNPEKSETEASIGFHLLASNGVTLTSANYDLNTQAGANVVDGSIPVPNDDSEITLGIRSLGAGDYVLAFSATGMYQGSPVPCTSPAVPFHLNAGQQLTLPTITLTCTVTNQVDNTSGVDANVAVAVETITIGSVIETFAYGPRTVKGHNNTAGMCVFPPVALKIAKGPTSTISYSWAASPDGTFGGTPENGTYQCVSGGTKTLTLTGTDGTTTSTKAVTVNCDESICASGAICGNLILETGEGCDEATARCVNCNVVPVCGDGVVDAPEQCDAVGLPTATCDIDCRTIVVIPPECGDGTVNQSTEECDNGSANSNTAPNACRVDCQNPGCGDSVTDTGEACDNGAANSDTTPNACRLNCTAPRCGDGVLDTGEECDAAMLPTASCDATCHNIPVADACDTCLHTSPAIAPYQIGYCDPDPGCLAVEACILGSQGAGCFSPTPAACYCGSSAADLDSCDLPTFVPAGNCATVMKENAGGAAASNEDVLNRLFTFGEWPMSNAVSILDLATRNCVAECGSKF